MKSSNLQRGKFNFILSVGQSEILWLPTRDFLPAKPVSGAQCRALDADDIERLSTINDFGLNQQLVEDFKKYGFVCIGMFVNNELAGLTLFASRNLPAHYNRFDDRFNGLNIALPAGTRCLFKAFVLPKFRGQRLHSAMVRFAIEHLGQDTVHTLVSTCQSANKAFLSSSKDQGFERVGKFTEFRLPGKSLFKICKPIDSLSGEPSNDMDDSIVLRRAA